MAQKILEVKIKLEGSAKPPIWRQVQIPANIDFWQFHALIQGTMGWTNSHLHHFFDRSRSFFIGMPLGGGMDDIEDGRKRKVANYLSEVGDKLFYEYDFGDGWLHSIEVKKVLSPEKGVHYPYLVKGKGQCPPEDCGGIWGYYDMVEAINNPKHPNHKTMLE